jgi:hypothetical protein
MHIHHHYAAAASPREARPPARQKIWGNVPARNPGFVGREDVLRILREALLVGDRAVVQALHGMGGVGKTQIAVEYAHRFDDEYDLVWWINAERPELIGEQLTALGAWLGVADYDAPLDVVRYTVLTALHEHARWLVVFDNAGQPSDLMDWLPGGRGHVLVTSRSHGWDDVAVPLVVDVLPRPECVAILRTRVKSLTADDAGIVADAVGDLPLAVAQAASYMARSGMSATGYVELLTSRAGEIMGEGRPATYPQSVAAVIQIAYGKLREADPAAAMLIGICAFLAPEPIPKEWITRASGILPELLKSQAGDMLAWPNVLSNVQASALADVQLDGLVMHRLTQAVIRHQLPSAEAQVSRDVAVRVLAANHPGPADMPATWSRWVRLLPHTLVLDPAGSSDVGLMTIAIDALWYLLSRGDAVAAYHLALDLRARWRDRLGSDDESVLGAANALAATLRGTGRYEDARGIDEDALTRERHRHGRDHSHALRSASNLATDLYLLGHYQAALELHEDTLTRRRQVMGEHHPETLKSADALAGCLRLLQQYPAARELHRDTLDLRRRLLGEDHPDTLASAANLGLDLYMLGQYEAARALDTATLERRRRVLGLDHPDTLSSAANLGDDLYMLREFPAARELHQDALTRRSSVLGADHPDTRRVEDDLAEDMQALTQTRADSPSAMKRSRPRVPRGWLFWRQPSRP